MGAALGICLPQSLANLDYCCLFLNLCIWDHASRICCVSFTFSPLFFKYMHTYFPQMIYYFLRLFCVLYVVMICSFLFLCNSLFNENQ